MTARDGAEAIRLFEEAPERLAAAVLDVDGTGNDGLAIFRALHGVRPGLPVVLVTGGDTALCTGPGAQVARAALLKPFDFRRLAQFLKELASPATSG